MKYTIAFATPVLALLAALVSGVAPAAAPAVDGGALFRQRCQGCHSVTPGQTSPLAPNLAGVVGRKAGSTGFNYSPALKSANLVWSRANIDRFLAGPGKLVPGTRMVIFIPDPKQRAAIVDYLAHTGT
jgi:cytochrome c